MLTHLGPTRRRKIVAERREINMAETMSQAFETSEKICREHDGSIRSAEDRRWMGNAPQHAGGAMGGSVITWLIGLFRPAKSVDLQPHECLTPFLQQAEADGLIVRWKTDSNGNDHIYVEEPE